ncbi:hypothetical protein [Nitrospira sp. KM1]|uniref:hypothetical protein n=1 Tax=Nitrospira sp. KM1 TaxID=1936990 RepID=UPI0015678826|nr:hypothetical protein [Nitrospira sp. KM1]
MILILADTTDPWATLLYRELRHSAATVVWIPPAQLLERVRLNWSVQSKRGIPTGFLSIDDTTVPLCELTGVFAQTPFTLSVDPEGLDPNDREYVTKEATAAWLGLLNALPCPVMNRPLPGGRPTILSGHSILAGLVAEHGFELPPSLYTMSKDDAVHRFAVWKGAVYLKPVGSHEAGIYLQPQDGVEQIKRVLEHQAVTMQQVPDGRRVTVYVVGGNAAATCVHSDDCSGTDFALSPVPAESCTKLTRALGLSFAECHLVVTSGRTCCLDISSTPAYWRCPREVRQRLISRLADGLSEPRSLLLDDSLDGLHGRSDTREHLCQTRSPEC